MFSGRYRHLKQQLDLKTEEAQILETKLQQSSFHKQQEELENLRRTIGMYTHTHTRPEKSGKSAGCSNQ